MSKTDRVTQRTGGFTRGLASFIGPALLCVTIFFLIAAIGSVFSVVGWVSLSVVVTSVSMIVTKKPQQVRMFFARTPLAATALHLAVVMGSVVGVAGAHPEAKEQDAAQKAPDGESQPAKIREVSATAVATPAVAAPATFSPQGDAFVLHLRSGLAEVAQLEKQGDVDPAAPKEKQVNGEVSAQKGQGDDDEGFTGCCNRARQRASELLAEAKLRAGTAPAPALAGMIEQITHEHERLVLNEATALEKEADDELLMFAGNKAGADAAMAYYSAWQDYTEALKQLDRPSRFREDPNGNGVLGSYEELKPDSVDPSGTDKELQKFRSRVKRKKPQSKHERANSSSDGSARWPT